MISTLGTGMFPNRRHAPLYGVATLCFTVILFHSLLAHHEHQEALPLSQLTYTPKQHPISSLIAQAERIHRQQEASKSHSLQAAFEAYRASHDGRSPPRGWDRWYKASQERNVCNLNRFAGMEESLGLFRALEPKEVRARIRLLDEGGIAGMVAVRDGNVLEWEEMLDQRVITGKGGQEENPFRLGFAALLDAVATDWDEELPDVDFIVNGLDEPRVVLDRELRTELEHLSKQGRVRPFTTDTVSFRSIHDNDDSLSAYEVIRRACPPNSPARLATVPEFLGANPNIHHENTGTFTLSESEGHFIFDHDAERSSWCDQPDLMELHASYINPVSFHYTHDVFPIFSNSKLPGFSDILIPSWFYFRDEVPYDPMRDPEWDNKEDKLFWRGSNTGGWAKSLNWKGWMRSRIVSKLNRPANALESEPLLLASNNDTSIRATLPVSALNSVLADIAFSSADQHGDADSLRLQAEEPSFRMTGRVPFYANHKAKAVADFDGTAYSGRFLTLMRSKSAVFKSRLYIEAIEETLIPWFHYVPLSVRFSEVYSLLGYFFGVGGVLEKLNEAGERIGSREMASARKAVAHDNELKRIAEQGTQWAEACGKKDDIISYAYLLALEWARIISDDRDEMNFVL